MVHASCGHFSLMSQSDGEQWFDAQMSRLSGIYRAQVRIILAVIGLSQLVWSNTRQATA